MEDRWGAAFVRIAWQASFGLGGSFVPDCVAGITGIRTYPARADERALGGAPKGAGRLFPRDPDDLADRVQEVWRRLETLSHRDGPLHDEGVDPGRARPAGQESALF